jgi:hypothetical protein
MKIMIRYLTLALVLGFLFPPAGAPAQTTSAPDEENLQAILDLMRSDTNPFKIRTLNQVMALTGPEAEKFWPIYQQYERELGAISKRGMALIRDFLELQAGGASDQKRWNDLARKWLKLKEDRLALWSKYQKKISKAVSAYRAAQFLQVEHQMALFTDLSIASEMPVITLQPVGDNLKPAKAVPTREETVLVHITATVEAIDYDKREVTLKGPLGNSVTFTVDERVKRLNEVRVGDTVAADYYVSVAAELRPPTAEERREPLMIVEGAGKAPPGTSPAGHALRQIKAVCTVEGLDRPTETVTLKGPLGRYASVRVADPANLPHLRIGDTVMVTYTEALAIALEKVSKTPVETQ